MSYLLLALAVNTASLLLAISILKITGKVEINLKWSCVSLALLALYILALATGGQIVPIELVISDPNWNWGGKILAIALWVLALFALTYLKRNFRPSEAGFTLRQEAGSIPAALIALGLSVSLAVLLQYWDGSGKEYDSETLWFQALLPGLDEEPIFRGLLLYFLSLTIVSARLNIFGAQINVAGAALTTLFGLIHGVTFDGQEWHFSLFAIFITGFYGFVLLWLRERTGSLVFPIIVHNCINLAAQLAPASG